MSERDPILPQRNRNLPPPIATSFSNTLSLKDQGMYVQVVLCALFTTAEGAMITLATTVVPTLAEDQFVSGDAASSEGLARLAEVWKGSLAALIFLGYALGTCIGGRLSDNWGRRPTILSAYVCMIGVNTFASMIIFKTIIGMTIPTLSVLRFLSGLVCGLGAPASMVLLSEAIPTPQRSRMMCLQGMCYVFGEMFCCVGLMLFLPRLQPSGTWWVTMTLWTTVPPGLLLLVSCPCLRESPRWLACEEHFTFVKADFKWMRSTEFWMTVIPVALALVAGNMSTLGLSYVWPDLFKDIGGNVTPATRLLIMKSTGIPAMFLGYIVISCTLLGHRISLLLVSIPIAVFTALACFAPTASLQFLLFGIISSISATVYFTILCIFTTEAFPTELRAAAVGVCFAVGRFGAIASPPIYEWLGKVYFSILLAVAVLVGSVALQAVPHETKGVDLRDWLEDIKDTS